MKTDAVLATIARALAPYLGETMARASTRAHCEKLGIDGAEITPEQLDTLIQKVGSGMNIFIGREKTAAVLESIRQALARGNGT
jgi:hypothetical protein